MSQPFLRRLCWYPGTLVGTIRVRRSVLVAAVPRRDIVVVSEKMGKFQVLAVVGRIVESHVEHKEIEKKQIVRKAAVLALFGACVVGRKVGKREIVESPPRPGYTVSRKLK